MRTCFMTTSPNHVKRILASINWSWQEGLVDCRGRAHRNSATGEARAYEEWPPIALVGKPTNHVFHHYASAGFCAAKNEIMLVSSFEIVAAHCVQLGFVIPRSRQVGLKSLCSVQCTVFVEWDLLCLVAEVRCCTSRTERCTVCFSEFQPNPQT